MLKLSRKGHSMVNGLWGKKIGMTQVFSEDRKVVPVTVIDVSQWIVTRVKTKDNDGYDAMQLGYLKDKYAQQQFSSDWLQSPQKYFTLFKEVQCSEGADASIIGKQLSELEEVLVQGDYVDVFGLTIGRGFQGAVKRHGFAGGPASHGSKLGRIPGSLSFMRSQGRVIKGKKMPGHMGVEQRVMKNLKVVKIAPESRMVLIKGSIPGKSGSLVFVRKRR